MAQRNKDEERASRQRLRLPDESSVNVSAAAEASVELATQPRSTSLSSFAGRLAAPTVGLVNAASEFARARWPGYRSAQRSAAQPAQPGRPSLAVVIAAATCIILFSAFISFTATTLFAAVSPLQDTLSDPTPPPPPALSPELKQLVEAFRSTGILAHGFHSASSWYRGIVNGTSPSDVLNMVAATSCGKWCSPFVLLHPELPVTVGPAADGSGAAVSHALVFAASRELWEEHVQCSAVIQSDPESRACAACHGAEQCPEEALPRLQVLTPCKALTCTSVDPGTCRQLRAGCAAHQAAVGEPPLDAQRCSAAAVRAGECPLLRTPDWCQAAQSQVSEPWHIRSADDFMKNFWRRDPVSRQCKLQSTQRVTFINYSRAFLAEFQRSPDPNVPSVANEVTMAMTPHGAAGPTRKALLNALLGLVVFRSSGSDRALQETRALASALRAAGKSLPIYALTNEPGPRALQYWRQDVRTDLLAAPYSLELIDMAE